MDLAEEGATKLLKNNTGYPFLLSGSVTIGPCLVRTSQSDCLVVWMLQGARRVVIWIPLAISELR